MIIREIGASLRALFSRLSSKTTTIAGTETVYLDDAGSSVKATLSDALRYGGGNSTRITTIGNANIHQSNTGALWLEVTGGSNISGNSRGAGAFDWQATRTVATRVANGDAAFAFGGQNTVSGANGVAFGVTNFVTASYGVCFGLNNVVSKTSGVAIGQLSSSQNTAQFAFGHAPDGGVGQVNIQTFYHATSDASATVLSITGTATERMVIPARRTCAITGLVTAMSDSTDGFKVKAWEIRAVITRDNSNNTRIVGTPIITELGADTEAASWAITSITADNTNESLAITVTGEAATNIRWQASLFYSQVGH